MENLISLDSFVFRTGMNPREMIMEWSEKKDELCDQRILNYLKSGYHLMIAPAVVNDPVTGKRMPSPAFLTDGIWLWTSYLYYCYEEYNITLPKDFISFVAEKNFRKIKEKDIPTEIKRDIGRAMNTAIKYEDR